MIKRVAGKVSAPERTPSLQAVLGTRDDAAHSLDGSALLVVDGEMLDAIGTCHRFHKSIDVQLGPIVVIAVLTKHSLEGFVHSLPLLQAQVQLGHHCVIRQWNQHHLARCASQISSRRQPEADADPLRADSRACIGATDAGGVQQQSEQARERQQPFERAPQRDRGLTEVVSRCNRSAVKPSHTAQGRSKPARLMSTHN